MKDLTTITEVIEAFKHRGFKFIGKTDEGKFRLQGQLIPPQSEKGYLSEIELDPQFLNLPRIRLLEIPPQLPKVIPHMDENRNLCYIAQGRLVLDIFDPIGQSIACLERASNVLGQIIKGEMVEDLVEEFFAYWKGWSCWIDLQSKNLGEQHCIVAENFDERSRWFITDDTERTNKKLKSFGYQTTDRTVLTYRIKTSAQPRPLTNNWPPKTVADILTWQGALDPKCRRKIHQRILDGKRKKVCGGVLILIESPLITYGFNVNYNLQNLIPETKPAYLNDPIYGLKIEPAWIFKIDDLYIIQRNIPKLKTLAGKHIAIVGCGTIGGYLSEMLVKAGAGLLGGKLTLVDFETLLPQNIGRHRLGFPDLLSNKAIAMANELKRLMPSVNVCTLPVDVTQAQLEGMDLLIDATGEEALGHWLCKNYLPHTPMLSVWIEGPGTVVRGLLRASNKGACYRCLWHNNKRGELKPTVDPLPSLLEGQGCEGLYVPFPASVSVQAASLGSEMVLDWVNGICSPSLRTRLIDRNHRLATPDCDPPPDKDCPICNS